jgi:malonate transporter and related proteins
MSEIVAILLPFFGLVGLGFGAGKWRKTPAEGLSWLNFFMFYLALPALFFELVAETPMEQFPGWPFLLTTTFGTYCTFAIAFSVAALNNGGNLLVSTIKGLVGSYSNSAFLAPGLTLAAFGSAAAIPTALIFTFEHAMLSAIVPMMMALGSTERSDSISVASSVGRSVFLHPIVIAIIVGWGAAASGLQLPEAIAGFIHLLASAAVPCALFTFGVGLSLRTPSQIDAQLPVVIGIKLILHPIIVYLLLSWIGGFDPIWVYTAVLMAALPPAANVYVLARHYHTCVEFASTAVLVATLLSVLTVLVALSLILADALPIDPFR